MFRHVVLIRLRPDVTGEGRDALVAALRGLPAQIPEIRAYEVAADAGLRAGNPDVGLVALFDDQAAWRAYVDHPAHRAVVAEHLEPRAAERVSVQFAVPD